MSKHHSTDYKISAIKHYSKTKNYSETCRIFGCKRTTLARWVKKYKDEKILASKKRSRKSYKIRKVHVKFIINTIKTNKLITLKTLDTLLRKKFDDYNISIQWLNEVIRANSISRKRTRIKHFPETRFGKKISKKVEMEKLFDKIKKYRINDIVSIDETSIKPGMMKEYCREVKGKRCYVRTTDNIVFRKFTAIIAINTKGLVGYKVYDKGGINTDRFLAFIKEKILDKNKGKLLLFDNAREHCSKKVLDEIIKSGNDYVFNVPYNPKSNPIESYFSQIKHYIKLDVPMSFNSLKISLEKAMSKVSKSNYKKYFMIF